MQTASWGVVLWSLGTLQGPSSAALGEPFENERLHLRVRPPYGWHLVNAGLFGDEPVEFWKEDEYGPRIQIYSSTYQVSQFSDLDEAQRELTRALTEQFPSLKVNQEKKLTHQGNPAIEVMATLEIENTYYHVVQRCLFARGRIYIITCASFESSFLYDLPAFRACLDSLEVLGKIYDPDSAIGSTGALIQPTNMGLTAIGFVASGFLLRRLSTVRLKRKKR